MAGILEMANAKIRYKNFAGRETEFNNAGSRNFHVVIEDAELAEQLKEDGWNVKCRLPQVEGDEPLYHMEVKVAFGMYPPKINLVSRRGVDANGAPVFQVTQLDEESVGVIDDAEFVCVDLIIRPYHWEKGSKSGIAAYLNEFWGEIKENEFARKYSNRG